MLYVVCCKLFVVSYGIIYVVFYFDFGFSLFVIHFSLLKIKTADNLPVFVVKFLIKPEKLGRLVTNLLFFFR